MHAHAIMARTAVALCAAGLLYVSLSRPQAQVQAAATATPDPFAFVKSMEGTQPDGKVRQDGAGALVVDAELGHLFDYYLAGLGEKDLAAITARIERELDARLGKAAAVQAKRLLANYLAYKRALAGAERSLPRTNGIAQAARARMAAMRELRLQFFTQDEIKGLFGFSDAYDDDALARIELSEDKTLTAAQRAEKLAALEREAPASIREEREAPARIFRTEETAQLLRAQGGSEDDVYRMRAAALSPEAANRLADLDREEAAWKARIANYLAMRAGLSDPQALQALRDQNFSGDEQKRLPAYE
jgi:lipase chaperone LimK